MYRVSHYVSCCVRYWYKCLYLIPTGGFVTSALRYIMSPPMLVSLCVSRKHLRMDFLKCSGHIGLAAEGQLIWLGLGTFLPWDQVLYVRVYVKHRLDDSISVRNVLKNINFTQMQCVISWSGNKQVFALTYDFKVARCGGFRIMTPSVYKPHSSFCHQIWSPRNIKAPFTEQRKCVNHCATTTGRGQHFCFSR